MLPILRSPLASAVLQAVSISAAANIAAQLLSQYRHGIPLSVDLEKFARFLTISIIMAPLNYCWQALLERTFPAERFSVGKKYSANKHDDVNATLPHESGETETLLLNDNDPPEEENVVEEGNIPEGGTSKEDHRSGGRQTINSYIRNTLLKLCVDCFLLGTWWNVVLFLILNRALQLDSGREIMRSVKTETVPIVLNAFKLWPFVFVIGLTLLPMEKRIVFYSSVNFFWGIYLSLVAGREP
ncbi:MAG: hypothetical protein HETSPECPRED_001997 [Heterodermia speciosa]|uniref:Uncharacterized protein n=1 Tax=Heterodermia speciosa TaxID=116794 RepID=A0A8H3EZK4_9LECA|nr:MAG: hypothetical protein HETSPECPRED_001997 [Heterodermia speciosa]